MANSCLRLLTFMCRIRAEIAEASLNKLAWQKRLSKVNRMIWVGSMLYGFQLSGRQAPLFFLRVAS